MDPRSEKGSLGRLRANRGAAFMGGLFVASLASCSLILDFEKKDFNAADAGDEIDAERPDIDAEVIIDAGLPDANAADCEALEPNDSISTAIAIMGGDTAAAVCPGGDQDFYSFTLAASTDLIITLTADEGRADANLDLQLFDAQGTLVSSAVGSENPEVISHTQIGGNALPAGTYAIEVFSPDDGLDVSYNLNLQLVPVTAAQ